MKAGKGSSGSLNNGTLRANWRSNGRSGACAATFFLKETRRGDAARLVLELSKKGNHPAFASETLGRVKETAGVVRDEFRLEATRLSRIRPPCSKPDMGMADEAIKVNIASSLPLPLCHTTAAW